MTPIGVTLLVLAILAGGGHLRHWLVKKTYGQGEDLWSRPISRSRPVLLTQPSTYPYLRGVQELALAESSMP